MYYATPNVKQAKFRWLSIGALVAIITWALMSVAFGFYVANSSRYNKTYGVLAGALCFPWWLWITNLALLLGSELDAELERGRELQSVLPLRTPSSSLPETPATLTRRKPNTPHMQRSRELRNQAHDDDYYGTNPTCGG